MASFPDQVMLRLAEPAAFGALLTPAAVSIALAASYDLSAVRLDEVRDVVVDELTLQYPLPAKDRTSGNWTQLVPAYTRTELAVERARPDSPVWIDILARLRVTVVTEIDPAGAESVVSEGIDEFSTVDEFRQRVPFVDVDAFMAEHGISTVEELREAFQYLMTTVRLRAAGPFDPDDPANEHTLGVTLATVAAGQFDLVEALRAAQRIREAGRTSVGAKPGSIAIDCAAPYAAAVVFAAEGPEQNGTTATEVEQLLARAGVAALFLTTS